MVKQCSVQNQGARCPQRECCFDTLKLTVEREAVVKVHTGRWETETAMNTDYLKAGIIQVQKVKQFISKDAQEDRTFWFKKVFTFF